MEDGRSASVGISQAEVYLLRNLLGTSLPWVTGWQYNLDPTNLVPGYHLLPPREPYQQQPYQQAQQAPPPPQQQQMPPPQQQFQQQQQRSAPTPSSFSRGGYSTRYPPRS